MALEPNALARLLQARREAAGYSRARLGALVGLSAGTIEGWELGRVGRPPFHEVMRIATFLGIPLDDLRRAVFEDAGDVPGVDAHPGRSDRRKPGRKKSPGSVPLLEAAFRLYGWNDDAQAAAALHTTAERISAWRRGTERMDIPEYLALTTTVNLALAETLGTRRGKTDGLVEAAGVLGVDA